MYLNEQQAKGAIEVLFQTYNSAFTLKITKREPKNLVYKYVYFEVQMPSLNTEVIFNDVFRTATFNNALNLMENKSGETTETFILQAQIQVIGANNDND